MQEVVSNKAWLLVGDLNVLAHPSKSSNFNGSKVPNSDIRDFIKCMQNLATIDHVYTGPLFTWSNRQEKGFMARKLDRVLVNCN